MRAFRNPNKVNLSELKQAKSILFKLIRKKPLFSGLCWPYPSVLSHLLKSFLGVTKRPPVGTVGDQISYREASSSEGLFYGCAPTYSGSQIGGTEPKRRYQRILYCFVLQCRKHPSLLFTAPKTARACFALRKPTRWSFRIERIAWISRRIFWSLMMMNNGVNN